MAARLLTPALLFALALAVRLLPWPTVIEKTQVVFFGMDAWYHMRRVALTLQNGWPPAFDPYLNFPHGAMPIWPPFFDAFVAAWVWPVHVVADWLAVEAAAALLPPVLGALCVVVLYRLALRLFDFTTAWVAGLLLCFLSAHFWYSQIGFVDHHAATALVTTLLLASAVRLTNALTTPSVEARRWALRTGGLAGVALLVWPGTLLHVGIVALGLGVSWLSRQDAPAARRAGLALAVASLAGFAVVAPFGWTSGWPGARAFSPTVLSGFQPWMFACLALLGLGCGALWQSGRFGRTRGARALQALAVGVGLLVASLWLLPQLASGFADAWRWFTKDEVFQGLVKESKPLFVGETGFEVGNAELRLSRWLYLTPFVWAAWLWRARRDPQRPGLWLVAAWTLVLMMATLLQRRFFNSLSPAYALGLAVALVGLVRGVPRLLPRAGAPLRAAARLAVVGVALVLFAPTLSAYRLPVSNLAKRLRGEPMMVPKPEISRRVLLQTAAWIAANTPATEGPLDPRATPEYGVMAPWGYGHLLKYVARRPTIVGNFGDDVGEENLRRATAYFASRELDAVRILDDLRARYVLVNSYGEVPPERLRGESMRKRLSADDSPGLEFHRLVYESPLDGRWAAIGRSEYRVFERVAGARLVGRAAPGAEVVARLEYESNRGRRGRFESRTTAGADGRYELRLPYATRGGPPGIAPAASYGVSAGGRMGRVVVPETAVRSGSVVEAPDLG